MRLFHLYVHEPLMRDGVSGVEVAEEVDELVAQLLPLAPPVMELVHRRYLRHFVERDVIGHMEEDFSAAGSSSATCASRSPSPTSPATRS